MNITILSKSDTEIEVEIGGEDHTLLNLLKDSLLRIEDVEAATYDMNPEQSGSKTDPVLYVKTDETDPLEAIEEATDNIKDETDDLRESVKESL